MSGPAREQHTSLRIQCSLSPHLCTAGDSPQSDADSNSNVRACLSSAPVRPEGSVLVGPVFRVRVLETACHPAEGAKTLLPWVIAHPLSGRLKSLQGHPARHRLISLAQSLGDRLGL